ncbi:hypothetical protein BO78DRAFT_391422 [Aspergillus sclerotiicarbonarius CBS 121057]|uniref:Uncharacterized protein n=1 Tax=Aspergillus sclerotiicarbonarius (strain CBS 121057 / IBT 28362) TaxID=1448318 RepID=A0A319EJI5_ASPSB|nr:hypothetical protein BO78DRAFT_391422 [Aspergillus sclerotiicarbonarius CBS 121057]
MEYPNAKQSEATRMEPKEMEDAPSSKHYDYPQPRAGILSHVEGGAEIRIRNPLVGLTRDELFHKVTDYAETHGLVQVVDLLKKGVVPRIDRIGLNQRSTFSVHAGVVSVCPEYKSPVKGYISRL